MNIAQVFGRLDFAGGYWCVIGSADGLICIISSIDCFLVCNPCTGARYVATVDLYYFGNPVVETEDYEPVIEWSAMGFGPSVGGYKIINIAKRYDSPEDGHRITIEISVFTLGDTVPRKTICMVPRMVLGGPGVYIHGALHWVQYIPMGVDTGIIVFSLEKEEFEPVMPLPEFVYWDDEILKSNLKLRMVCGKLAAYFCIREGYEDIDFEMWVMEEYGVKDSWTRIIVIDTEPVGGIFRNFMEPVSLLSNGSVLMNLDFKSIAAYDPKKKTYRTIKSPFPLHPILLGGMDLVDVVHLDSPPRIEYVETLVSPLRTKTI